MAMVVAAGAALGVMVTIAAADTAAAVAAELAVAALND